MADQNILAGDINVLAQVRSDVKEYEGNCDRLYALCPALLCERYRLGAPEALSGLKGYEILEAVGRRRGYLISGGEVDLE